MSTEIKFRRGTTAQHATFIGALGEVTVDTDKKTVVVHDGITAGGSPIPTVANNIPSDNSISTAKLQDSAVTTIKVADDAITTPKLVNGILSADTNGRAKMADAFITLAKLVTGLLTADTTGRSKMADGFVNVAKLATEAKPLGTSQTWQDFTGTRLSNTSYQNTTGRPIEVAIMGSATGVNIEVSPNNSTWIVVGKISAATAGQSSFTVPDTWYYRTAGSTTISNWAELR